MRNAPVLLTWRDVSAASARAPLRLLEAPGVALLRQNLPWLQIETNPLPSQLERVVRAKPRATFANFDLARLDVAMAAARTLARAHNPPIAVRGRLIASYATAIFESINFEPSMLGLLADLDLGLPARFVCPLVLAELFDPRLAGIRLGCLFSRIPEPSALSIVDLMRSVAREGRMNPCLDQTLRLDEARALLDASRQAGARGALVVDLGGDAQAIAELARREGMLGAYLGPASSPIPAAVTRSGCPVISWFEPEDLLDAPLRERESVAAGIAMIPVAIDGDDVPNVTARMLALRELGYGAIVPRYFVPLPNTHEWLRYESRYGLKVHELDKLAGDHLVFDLPGFGPVEGPELLQIWRGHNRWPKLAANLGKQRRGVSFEHMRAAIDGYLADSTSSVPDCHARDMLARLMAELGPNPRLEQTETYPFVNLEGESLYDIVQRAIEARLLSFAELPPELLTAIRHAVLVGGKRIRPILTLVIACAHGVPLDAAMPAALATEWLHTASLIQDDMPCMDDDDVRRRDVATHRRFGEGVALLASDALVALALGDLAALAEHEAVGPERAAKLVLETTTTMGAHGLVGGQVRDLLTRRREQVGLQEVLEVHRRKTMPLFRLTATLATTLAGLPKAEADELAQMLSSMGLAFQIIDDLLDATPSNEAFGRPAGSDRRNTLPTFATLMGSTAGRRYAAKVMAPYTQVGKGKPGLFGLQRLSRFILEREQ